MWLPLSFCGYDRIWNSCVCQSICVLIYVCGHPSASVDMTGFGIVVSVSLYISYYMYVATPSAFMDMTGFGIVVSVSLYIS